MTGTVIVRAAQRADVPAIVRARRDPAFRAAVGSTLYTVSEFERMVTAQNALLLVVTVNNRVVGWLAANLMTPEWAQLDIMYVQRRYRSRGIGSALLRRLRQRLALSGRTYLSTLIRPAEHGLLAYYEKAGFRARDQYVWLDTSIRPIR